eukprot:TRINITY_DN7277_c0_g2_i1.p1 TRINITY_DN7277_c0_g2~~TRINITY_DN7277_c0_g2_i1.p1  ORF type:complete len:301 (+),score=15.53 TRINITY_DN7277_c0_g2_i1:204-1106(+)
MSLRFLCLFVTSAVLACVANARTINIYNQCNFTVYPAIYTSSKTGSPTPSQTGWVQQPGQTYVISTPSRWTGRIWARTGCDFSKSVLQDCETGYCVGGQFCTLPGVPPVTLAELNLEDTDYYDVSNVDGFNIPMALVPSNPLCTIATCEANINLVCPPELQLLNPQGRVVGCSSACEKFKTPEYCCTNAFSTPDKCVPTYYSNIFKAACPAAYSYAYDDLSSLFLCSPSDYSLFFCPTPGVTLPRPPHSSTATPTTPTTPNPTGVCNGRTYSTVTHVCDGNQICPIHTINCNCACYSHSS